MKIDTKKILRRVRREESLELSKMVNLKSWRLRLLFTVKNERNNHGKKSTKILQTKKKALYYVHETKKKALSSDVRFSLFCDL